MGVVFTNNGNSMWTWEKSGKVYVSKWSGTTYVKQSTPVLDISDEVGDWRDLGLFSFCPDPAFETNGLVYLYYVVDRHHLLFAGTPQYNIATSDYFKATIARVTRYRLNLNATVTTDYSSRKVLIGESITTGIPVLHESHLGGTLIFGRDGTLLLTTGDAASYNGIDLGSASDTYYQQALTDGIIRPAENVGAFRSQMLNAMNGKLLRFDPNTGNGIVSNPYYDALNPRAPKSRVWALGFRNPFRMSIQPNTGSTNPADGNPGTFLIGDVGFYTWEEINVIFAAGLNCGWPVFEGEVLDPDYGPQTTVNADEGVQFRNLIAQPTSFTLNSAPASNRFAHYRPSIAWKHGTNETRVAYFNGTTPTDPLVGAVGSPTTGQSFAGNCAIGGVYYTSNAFGPAYQNTYFFADYGTNTIKVANLNSTQPWFSNISNFAPENFTKGIVDMEQNPLDNSILYVNINTGEIMRIALAGSQPPVVAISSDKKFGPSPLSVNFSSSGSTDPDGGPLQYLWSFGDGTTSTAANPTHIYSGTGILSFTATLTVMDQTSLSSSKSLLISINNTPPTAKITNPVNNSTYSILTATQMQLSATVTDNETTTGMQYAWQVILRHNNHEHRDPVVNSPNPIVQISPVGCDGETYYYMIQLTVTDNGGLTSADSVKIYPDCSTVGLAVTNLTATPQINSVALSWTNPSASFDEVMVAAKASTGFLTNPSGTNYVANSDFNGGGTAFEGGKIVYKGTGQSVTVTNLVPGTTYYFRGFTRIGTSWTGGVETSAAPAAGVNVTGVTVTPTSATLSINATQQLTATIAPANATNKNVAWSSSNSTVTTVSSTGLVTAVAAGSAVITVTTQDGGKIATCNITVTQVAPGALTGSGVTSASTVNLTAQGTSDWAHWSGYAHKASGGAKISNYSVVGTGTVTNYTSDPRRFTWSDGTPTVSGSNRNGIYIAGAGKGFQITAPADLTQRTLKVYVGGSATGGTFTASLSDGSAPNYVNSSFSGTGQYDVVYTLTYKAASAGKLITVKWVQASGTGNVRLQAATLVQSSGVVNVTGVTISPTSASLPVNGTQQLTATIIPSNATNKNVTWSSSNNAVATVSSAGLVTALAAGSAVITVTTQDGAKTATCNITVTQTLSGVLSGSGLSSFATVNLTSEGSSDWAHWSGYDHKSSGGSKISNYAVVGTGSASSYSIDGRACTWSDGTPTASGSNKDGIYITGVGKGFQITVPADLTQRTLKVYAGGWTSGGILTASLSDGSAPNYIDSSFSANGRYDVIFTLSYKAASAGRLLTVKWVQTSGIGNVALQAAALVENTTGLITLARNNSADSIEGRLTSKSLIIFPNPFNDNLVIRYSGNEIGRGVVSLYTSEMRLVATYPFEKTFLTMDKQITPKGLINGLYIIEFRIGQTKIIRQQLRLK